MAQLVGSEIVLQGRNCFVRVDVEDENGSNPIKLGLVKDVKVGVNIQVNKAECIGHMLPVSMDAQGVEVSISISGYIPRNLESLKAAEGDNCTAYIKALNPGEGDILSMFAKDTNKKIPYIDFYDARNKEIIGSSTWAIVESYNESLTGRDYYSCDINLKAIGYKNGSSYKTII